MTAEKLQKFEPWVGRLYGKEGNLLGGTSMLLVTESHYHDDPSRVGTCDPGCTEHVVETMALNGPGRIFTNLTKLITGRPKWALSRDELEAVWASVAFYNYVPVFAADKAGEPPRPWMIKAGREPFEEVLRELKPEAILVCSHRAWRWILEGHAMAPGDPDRTPFMAIGGAVAGRMRHPSRYFAALKHRPILLELLDRAEAARAPAPPVPRDVVGARDPVLPWAMDSQRARSRTAAQPTVP